jgi:hypothetical protein
VCLLEIDGIGERLLVSGAELIVGAHRLFLARPSHLVEILEVARVGQRLGCIEEAIVACER